MADLNADYWQERYQQDNTPWDIGYAAPALVDYVQQLPRDTKILIPGAGRAYEAVALHQAGYHNIYVCDWAESAFHHLCTAAPDFPAERQLVTDFFAIEDRFDLLLEQTFFCALHPDQRPAYVRHAHHLLRGGGRLAGLLFASVFPFAGPPFGGDAAEYRALFEPYFTIHQLQLADNSIKPRLGNELFVELEVK